MVMVDAFSSVREQGGVEAAMIRMESVKAGLGAVRAQALALLDLVDAVEAEVDVAALVGGILAG